MDNDKIREIVKKEAEEEDWKYHILIVEKYAKILADKLGADKEIVELAVLLHDIGRIKFSNKDHDITGSKEAEKILREEGYPEDIIKKVKHCIETHRASKDKKPETLEAEIIANADAMSHFDSLPLLIYWRGKNKKGFEESIKWLEDKLDRDWNKKITISEAREMCKEKYKTSQKILKWIKENK